MGNPLCVGREGAVSEAPPAKRDVLGRLVPGVVAKTAPEPEAMVQYAGSGPWSTSSPEAGMPPRLSKIGMASAAVSPPTTMIALLTKAAAVKGGKDAMLAERPVPPVVEGKVPPPLPRGGWTAWMYEDYLHDVRRVAKAFVAVGLREFESVAIWGFNSPEWFLSAMGAMFAGGKCAGLDLVDKPESAAFKVTHSCASVVVAEDRRKIESLAKELCLRGDCRRLKAFVAWGFEPSEGETVAVAGIGDVPLLSWAALLALGDTEREAQRRSAAVRPGHCAALIYTLGTTGEPKAVMVSHDSLIFEAASLAALLHESRGFGGEGEERVLSYLPLSHIASFLVDVVLPLFVTASLPGAMCSFFARPCDVRGKALKDRLSIARPTLFLGAPLVWEKVADDIRMSGAMATPLQQKISAAAKGVALQLARNPQLGGDGDVPWGHALANTVVLSKIKARFRLDQCKYGFTVAAPIRRDTLDCFGALGISINEASECAGASTMSTEEAHPWGSIGWEMPGFEVKVFAVDPKDISKKTECPRAPDLESAEEQYQGELCFRGRTIMMGYMACPDLGPQHLRDIEAKNAETIDAEGWLHSGDRGMITVQGMVRITGRCTRLNIGEGGGHIAPEPVEECIKQACDGISDVVMVGDKREYSVALVMLKAVGASGESSGTQQLDAGAKRVNPEVTTIAQAMDDKVWIDTITMAIQAANGKVKVCRNNAFKIHKFAILPTSFSEEGNEFTPTKKLKREVVEGKYAEIIERIYATEGFYVRCSP